MSEIRFAKNGDLARLKEIWKLCFGDSDQDIDFYYANRYQEDETLLLLQQGEIAAMLTMLPIRVNTVAGRSVNSTMLYAIATHPQYQRRGYAAQLIEAACHYSSQKGNTFSVLVPAEKRLFDYYRNQGFQDGFYLREMSFGRERLESFPIVENNCTIKSISSQEYNLIRERQLSGKVYVSYTVEEIDYQRKMSQQSGADIYGMEMEGVKGCAIIEIIEQGKVYIKELLIADRFLATAVRHIARLLPSAEYQLHLPPFLGSQFPGSIRPFGMIKANQGDPEITPVLSGYLGLAFD